MIRYIRGYIYIWCSNIWERLIIYHTTWVGGSRPYIGYHRGIYIRSSAPDSLSLSYRCDAASYLATVNRIKVRTGGVHSVYLLLAAIHHGWFLEYSPHHESSNQLCGGGCCCVTDWLPRRASAV